MFTSETLQDSRAGQFGSAPFVRYLDRNGNEVSRRRLVQQAERRRQVLLPAMDCVPWDALKNLVIHNEDVPLL